MKHLLFEGKNSSHSASSEQASQTCSHFYIKLVSNAPWDSGFLILAFVVCAGLGLPYLKLGKAVRQPFASRAGCVHLRCSQ